MTLTRVQDKDKMVHKRPSNNNEALEKVTKVNPVEINKKPGVQITRCQCVKWPELVKNNKIKTLLLSFAQCYFNCGLYF